MIKIHLLNSTRIWGHDREWILYEYEKVFVLQEENKIDISECALVASRTFKRKVVGTSLGNGVALMGRPELSSFSRAYTVYAGGGDQGPPYAVLKCRLWCISILRRVSKSTFSKYMVYSFGREGGGHKKDDPLEKKFLLRSRQAHSFPVCCPYCSLLCDDSIRHKYTVVSSVGESIT